MKKLLSFALTTLAVASASAADFTVYQNGTLAQDVVLNPWWNIITNGEAENPAGEGKVWSLTYNPAEPGGGATGPNFCAGLQAISQSGVTGPLAKATLTFKYYATTACKITIRLDGAGVEENWTFPVSETETNKWMEASCNVEANFPKVSAIWDEWKNEGLGDVMGVVVEDFNAETVLYINDVIYTNINEDWKKPSLGYEIPDPIKYDYKADDVLSLLSNYPAATAFNIGNWGQTTQVAPMTAENGMPLERISIFNYLGWEFTQHLDVTGYDYFHVDFWPVDETKFGFTIISPDREKAYIAQELKEGEWNSFSVPVSYWDNVNLNDIFQIKFDQGTGGSGFIANVFFYKDNSVKVDNMTVEEGVSEYYNLQGVKVANPEKGLYIVVKNGEARKVIL